MGKQNGLLPLRRLKKLIPFEFSRLNYFYFFYFAI